MKRILVLFAHPSPRRSKLNQRLVARLQAVPNVIIRDLYELYPDFHINVAAEQALLRQADLVVMQFPIHWFGAPAIIREWQDSVLTAGFAFGPGGDALKGKNFMLVVSTGGGAASYCEGRPHGAAIESYLLPYEQTAVFCGMTPACPFIVHAARGISVEAMAETADDLANRMMQLAQDRADSKGDDIAEAQ